MGIHTELIPSGDFMNPLPPNSPRASASASALPNLRYGPSSPCVSAQPRVVTPPAQQAGQWAALLTYFQNAADFSFDKSDMLESSVQRLEFRNRWPHILPDSVSSRGTRYGRLCGAT